MSEFASDNFFSNLLLQYYLDHGQPRPENIISLLNKSPFDLTDKEKTFYLNAKDSTKRELEEIFKKSGATKDEWLALPNTSQSIIGMLASEMLGEMVATPVETPVLKEEIPVATPVETPGEKVAIPEQKIIQNMQMSFFTTQYYQYCIEHSRQVPEILIRILDKAPLGFKKEEREYYTSKVVPYKQNINKLYRRGLLNQVTA